MASGDMAEDPLAGFVSKVEALSQADPAQLAVELKRAQVPPVTEQYMALLGGVFDVAVQSLGWLEVLHACQQPAHQEFFDAKCNEFLLRCSTDVKHCAEKFVDVCSTFATHLIERNQAIQAIRPLKIALEKISPGRNHLTSIHHEIIKVCIKAQLYTAALPVLDENILFLPSSEKIKTVDVLCYFYYGGVAYAAMKKFDRALEFFSVAISVPGDSVSSIMVEAYKKYWLICLLKHGHFIDLPPYTSYVQRQVKQFVQLYDDLNKAHKTGDVTKFEEQLAKHEATLRADKNWGLAKQIAVKMTRRNIKKLTDTFLTLSLSAIAERVKLPDANRAETALINMISDNEIHATIDQLTGTVSFHDDDEQYDTEATMQLLDHNVAECAKLLDHINNLDVELRKSPKYIKRTQAADGPGLGDLMDVQLDHGF